MGRDETVPDNIQRQWKKWERQKKGLEGLSVDRRFKLANFGKFVERILHHFSDACEYGQASYLCLVDETGRFHHCLVIGKSRVAPSKYITVLAWSGTGSCKTFCENIDPSEKGILDKLQKGNILNR